MKTYYEFSLQKTFLGIKTAQVESETPCTITINGNRRNKISTYNCYCSDLETAKRELLNYYAREIRQAESNIRENEKLLKRFKKYLLEVENYQT